MKLATTFAAAVVAAVAPVPHASRAPAPLELEYRVVEPATGAVLLASTAALQPERPTTFARRAAAGPEELNLSIEAHPRSDGRITLELGWDEQAASGEKIRWTPILDAQRGEPVEARVDWAGTGRAITLTVR